MKSPVLEISNLSKRYQSTVLFKKNPLALDNVSFKVNKGDIFGFLGPNGAGKTTLIKILVGIMAADSGECLLNDKMGAKHPSYSRYAKSFLGYLPERPYFHDFLTAEEFLTFHGTLMSLSAQHIRQQIPILLKKVGLSKSQDQKLRTFSKGMLQRIGFAQALIHDPEILVLDEPMSGLDPVGRREVRDMISEVASLGKTIFFSSHIIHDVEVICDSVAFINFGKLQGVGSIESLLGKTIKSVEIRFNSEKKLESQANFKLPVKVKQTLDGYVINYESDAESLELEVNKILETLIHEKAIIQSVVPRKSTLEDLFFNEGAPKS